MKKNKNILLFLILLLQSFSIQSIIAQEFDWFNPGHITGQNLNSLCFYNEHIGWVSGDNGTILKTIDRGFNWNKQETDITEPIVSLFFVDSLNGWATSEHSGTILNTNDGGNSWHKQFQIQDTIESAINSIFFGGPDTGFAVGFKYNEINYTPLIFKTTTGGLEWTSLPIDSSGFFLTQCHLFSNESAIIVGGVGGGYIQQQFGVVLITKNNGQNWDFITNKDLGIFNSISFTNDSVGWATTQKGQIIYTEDGGRTWSVQFTDEFLYFSQIKFANDSTGWVTSSNSHIFSTSDGGEHWNKSKMPGRYIYYISDLFFFDQYKGYAIGNNLNGWGGYFWRYDDITAIDASNFSTSNISIFSLSQNFPNPFNPITTINYHLPQKSNLEITVYNASGKKVKTLYNGIKTGGEHSIIFDGSDLSSGIYFVELSAGNFRKSIKTLLLK